MNRFPSVSGKAYWLRSVSAHRLVILNCLLLLSLAGSSVCEAGIILTPNDVVALDTGYTGTTANSNTGGAILDFAVQGGGTGSETLLASNTVGSGVTYGQSTPGTYLAVSPDGMIYYCDRDLDFVQLNPATHARTVVSDPLSTSQGTVPVNVLCLTWDFATGTILYYDHRSGTGSPPYMGSGFYRVDPATGLRTAVSLQGGRVSRAQKRPPALAAQAMGHPHAGTRVRLAHGRVISLYTEEGNPARRGPTLL